MDESVAIGAAAVRPDGDDAPSGISPREYDMCSEQCCLNHSTTISGRLYNKYYYICCSIQSAELEGRKKLPRPTWILFGVYLRETNPAPICMRASVGALEIKL